MHKGIDKVEFEHFFERKTEHVDAAAELLKKDQDQISEKTCLAREK